MYEHALAYLGISKAEAAEKRNEYSVDYDKMFSNAIARGEVHSTCYWLDNRKKEDPNQWKFVMKYQFGWGVQSLNQKTSAMAEVNYDADKPLETIANVAKCLSENKIPSDVAKILTEVVIESYVIKNNAK